MKPARSAFTLVEMLIAVVLLTMLIGTELFAFRYQLLTFKRIEPAALDRVLAYHQLRSSIQSMHYYVVDSYSRFEEPQDDLHFYFEGRSTTLRYITKSPMFSDSISVADLVCTDDVLRYTEEPLFSGKDYLRPDIYATSPSIKLFSDLSYCHISYITDKGKKEELERNIPIAVEIDLKQDQSQFTIYAAVRADNNLTLARIRDLQREQ